jgi:putative NIF3 family GTP cyclohydrolase 1 type 2
LDHIRYVTIKTREIKKVGLCAGSGSNLKYFKAAISRGCDAYLTGDIKFHQAQLASIMGLPLVDVTHYASELPIVDKICGYLRAQAKKDDAEIEIIPSSVNGQIFQTIASGGDLHG